MVSFVKKMVSSLQEAHTYVCNESYLVFNNLASKFDESFSGDLKRMIADRIDNDLIIKTFSQRNPGWKIFSIVRDEDPYSKVNIGNAVFGVGRPLTMSFNIYGIKAPVVEDEDQGLYANLTPGKLFNINNNSVYCMSFDDHLNIINFFLRMDFLGKDPKDISGDDLKVYLLDFRGCIKHFVDIRMGDNLMADNSKNILTNVLTVSIVKQLIPLTPEIVANAFGTTTPIAEDLIDAYDVEKGSFAKLPWVI